MSLNNAKLSSLGDKINLKTNLSDRLKIEKEIDIEAQEVISESEKLQVKPKKRGRSKK